MITTPHHTVVLLAATSLSKHIRPGHNRISRFDLPRSHPDRTATFQVRQAHRIARTAKSKSFKGVMKKGKAFNISGDSARAPQSATLKPSGQPKTERKSEGFGSTTATEGGISKGLKNVPKVDFSDQFLQLSCYRPLLKFYFHPKKFFRKNWMTWDGGPFEMQDTSFRYCELLCRIRGEEWILKEAQQRLAAAQSHEVRSITFEVRLLQARLHIHHAFLPFLEILYTQGTILHFLRGAMTLSYKEHDVKPETWQLFYKIKQVEAEISNAISAVLSSCLDSMRNLHNGASFDSNKSAVSRQLGKCFVAVSKSGFGAQTKGRNERRRVPGAKQKHDVATGAKSTPCSTLQRKDTR
ncbi:hypothetical protein CC80DRAFT_546736 [Byssothecium circinans]|uniref:Uncharacterized protein n=1 Tax=Byssothecium circinans TaxID=147558 RepID=A0A6A5U6A5_9PLEO|nr:hypothetical protein CC80DRAFT_546736 [Byssothecium circinans]